MKMEVKRRVRIRSALNKVAPKVATTVKYRDSSILWWLLAGVRVYLATVQTGYIHPDEFHQSLQVMARDLLGIDANKPWEFDCDKPIRSVTFSGLVSLPYMLLRYIGPLMEDWWSVQLLTPHILLVAPRIFMTLLSFIADYSIYRTARLFYIRPWCCLDVFASSYIMLVYATRTFSNTIELVLMSVLLWRVCESMVDSTKIIRKDNILQDLYETAETLRERVRLARMRTRLPSYNFVDSAVISVVITYGVFVRPTFLVYSFVPLAYWLQRGVITKELDFSYFNLRCLSLLPGIVSTFLICVVIDSFYYGSITYQELIFWNVTSQSFTVTPVNFLMYNSKHKNLVSHGRHPYYLHLLVNIPLLHGILGVLGLWSVSRFLAALFTQKMLRKPRISSMATMLLLSFILPVFVLSTVPHQEPRFLLPTLPPLVLLHSDSVVILTGKRIKILRHLAFLLWHVWNILCVVFFGFLHQGGVTKTMVQVHQHSLDRSPHTNMHVVFSRLYSPPTFLLVQKLSVLAHTDEGRKFLMTKSLYTYESGSREPVKSLHHLAANIRRQALANSTRGAEIVLCIPATRSKELFASRPPGVQLRQLHRVWGHLTLEDPPNLAVAEPTPTCSQFCQLMRCLDQFSVDIISVDFEADGERDDSPPPYPPPPPIDRPYNTSTRSSGEL